MKLIWHQLNDLIVAAKDGDVVGRKKPINGAPLLTKYDTCELDFIAGWSAKYRSPPWGNCTAKRMLELCQNHCEKPLGIYRRAIVDSQGRFVPGQAGWNGFDGLRIIVPAGPNWINAPDYNGATTAPQPVAITPLETFTWTGTGPILGQEDGDDLVWTRLNGAEDPDAPIARGDIIGPLNCDLPSSYVECVTATDGPDFGNNEGVFIHPVYWIAGTKWRLALKTCQENTDKRLYYYRLKVVPEKIPLNAFHSQPAPLP